MRRVVVSSLYYVGNRYLNSLDNRTANPRAGLIFIDFSQGDLLQMTDQTELDLDSPAIASLSGGGLDCRFAGAEPGGDGR